MKEKTLSEKGFEIDGNAREYTNAYWEEDVRQFIKEILQEIRYLIEEEKFCMARDKYPEQELEHINQIVMANKIKNIIKQKAGKDLIK